MKKVLMIIPSNNGTIARCSLNLYKALCQLNDIETKVVMVHRYEKGFKEFEQCEFFTNGEGSFVRSLFQSLGRTHWIKSIKRKFNPDLTISTLSGCSTLNVKGGGKDYKIGLFHAPNTQIKGLRLQYLVSQYSYKHIYPKLDKLFCVNAGLYDFFIQNYPWIDKNKLEVVYNVHPVDDIRAFAKEDLDNSNEEIIFRDNKVILFCGRLEYVKAPTRLLKAFGNSRLPQLGYKLVFIGEERQVFWTEMKEIASSIGVDNNIHYLSVKTNPYKYMARSEALVSSSKSEGLPGVLIESLILEKPVVATNSSKGIWEILSCVDHYDSNLKERYHTKDGIITPNTDNETLNIEQLSLALNEIVGDEYAEINAPFIKKVSGKYIVEKYLKSIR